MNRSTLVYIYACICIYIYILVCSCAYPCTDECGSDVKVGLVVKLIGGKVWITNSITRANEMWARSPRLALSRRTLHYPKVIWTKVGINVGTIVEVGTISAYLSLSKKGFGPTFAKLAFCEVELVQFRAMWALSEVNWAQNWTKWALSKVDLEQNLTKWTLSGTQIKRRGRCRGQIWPKIKQSGHCRSQIWTNIW